MYVLLTFKHMEQSLAFVFTAHIFLLAAKSISKVLNRGLINSKFRLFYSYFLNLTLNIFKSLSW